MSDARPEAIDRRLVRALAHPLRVQILEALSERISSPNSLAEEFGVELGHVAYHTRTLERCGCLELVETAQRRGATEHFYRAVPGAFLSWMPLELDERGWEEVAKIVEQARRQVRAVERRSAGRRGGGARRAGAVVALASLETGGSEGASAPSEPPSHSG